MNRDMIADLIKRHEGLKTSVYVDTTGHLTIGYGFNLDSPNARNICQQCGVDYDKICAGEALTITDINCLFDYTLNRAIADAQSLLPNFSALADEAQAVVVDMSFNLGRAGLGQFRDMLSALEEYDYKNAAIAAADSLWYRQVGIRGVEDVQMLQSITT